MVAAVSFSTGKMIIFVMVGADLPPGSEICS
jgi:hypothetical protein